MDRARSLTRIMERFPHANEPGYAGDMRRILLAGIAGIFLVALATRAADAMRVGGPRLTCGCSEACWCKRPGLTVFRWVTPGRWHGNGLSAKQKRFLHS